MHCRSLGLEDAGAQGAKDPYLVAGASNASRNTADQNDTGDMLATATCFLASQLEYTGSCNCVMYGQWHDIFGQQTLLKPRHMVQGLLLIVSYVF